MFHPIREICTVSSKEPGDEDTEFVIIVQPLVETGSLRDEIHHRGERKVCICVSHYVHDFITTAVASGYVASGSIRYTLQQYRYNYDLASYIL